eukprot:PhF_6_TR29160/c0_g1_i2/m.42627
MTSIRVLTYNVNFGPFAEYHDVRADRCRLGDTTSLPPTVTRVADAILQYDADVVLLQETNTGWEVFLRKALNESVAYRGASQWWLSPNNSGYYASGSAVIVKSHLTLKGCAVVPTSTTVKGSFFDQLVGCVEIDDHAQLRFINVHLRPPLAMGDDGNGLWANTKAYMVTSPKVHASELKECWDHINTLYPAKSGVVSHTVVAGDFNEGARGGAVQLASSSLHLQNALDVCTTTKTTWEWPLAMGMKVWGSYDHIFYDKRTMAVKSCVVGSEYTNVSDHVPVCAEIQLLTQEGAPVSTSRRSTSSRKK